MKWDRFTVMSQEAFQLAQSRAEELGHQELRPEHLFWAFLNQKGNIVNSVLAKIGVSENAFLQALMALRGTQRVTDQQPEGKYQVLERYARDITASARQGKLDPVIGRKDEIRRVIQVLSRRTKNNPVLIGEAGVGKTELARALA